MASTNHQPLKWPDFYGLNVGKYTVAVMDLDRWLPCIVKNHDGDPQGNGEIVLVMDEHEVPDKKVLLTILAALDAGA